MTSRDALKQPGALPEGVTWAQRARAVIAMVDSSLPDGATLAERVRAIDAAYPFTRRAHYPYQVWCRARRNYLVKFGYVPANAPCGCGPLLKIMEGKAQ